MPLAHEGEMAREAPGAGADWWRGAIIYQIYPRSFQDSDGDGVGDLPGVIAKLDYVASLGVDGIWLSPFFTSPMRDFGYDVSDYRDVDPLFGTLADFDALLTRAHALGLKVIIDQVWSHTSDQHPWFRESAASRENPRADWYVWADAKADGSPPNNWQAVFGGPSWTWNPRRRQYYLHNFLIEQPDLNYWSDEVQGAILGVARFWLDRGVDGFRLDVINFILHDRDLTDNPVAPHGRAPAAVTHYQRHVQDRSQPGALAFLARLRALMDSYGARMTVGEIVDEDPFARQIEYTATPDRLSTAYGFHFLTAREANPELFIAPLEAWKGADGWPAWSLSNHDVDRYPTRLAGDNPRLTRLLFAALLCLRGTIFLYQGDELGLPQGRVAFDRLRDPFAIAAYDGGAFRDGARTPMPWTTDGPAAGFSTNKETWLPVDPAHRLLAVAVQEGRPDSMLTFSRRLIAAHRRLATLRLGAARTFSPAEGVLAIERSLGEETLLCLFNLADVTTEIAVADGAELVLRVDGREEAIPRQVALPGFGGVILRVSR